MKYKTELCRNYTTYGSCSYSSRCQFAHGYEELRSRTRHPKYKTELCRNFLTGFCKYGSRCQFVHQTDEHSSSLICSPTGNISSSRHFSLDFLSFLVAAIGSYLLTNLLAQTVFNAHPNSIDLRKRNLDE